jgi:mRNA-degrading endonuclease toxin of MazEF toxin-antitoxin module
MNIEIGDILYVKYPYAEDNTKNKIRPAIVIAKKDDNSITVVKCTSNPKKRSKYDYTLKNSNMSNLVDTGNVRCNKICEVKCNKNNIIKKSGKISKSDLKNIIKLLDQATTTKKVERTIKEFFELDELTDVLDESTAMASMNPIYLAVISNPMLI